MRENVDYPLVLLEVALRYIFFAGLAYLLFYGLRPKSWLGKKIQKRFPGAASIRMELFYSVITVFIFSLIIYIFLFSPVKETTRVYRDMHQRSAGWFFFSLFLVVLLHDTYFYWTHRLMHWRRIFRYVHAVHHRSHNPTPWAAYSFHPLEALIEVGIVPLAAYLIPLHTAAFGLFGMYMISMNVMGHLGYELFPTGFMRNRFLSLYNSSTHHNMHHHCGKSNYGLYFNIWDRLMGTNHKHYREEFLRVAGRHRKGGTEKKVDLLHDGVIQEKSAAVEPAESHSYSS